MNNKPPGAVKRYGHISYLVEAIPQILTLYPDMTVYVKASDFDALQAENEALAGGLRGKHELTGATYTHLVIERDGLREEVDTLKSAALSIRDEWRKDQAEVASLRTTLDEALALLRRFNHAVRNDCSRATYKPIAVEAQAFLAANVTACDKPPAGWSCSRDKGHDGPCAATQVIAGIPVVVDDTLAPNEIRVVQGGRCSRALWAEGKAAPKTCAKCGLGPCNLVVFSDGAFFSYPPVPADRKLPVHCPQPQAHPARCGCEDAK